MNITSIQYFIETAKTESMSAAAENLFVSHQGLSAAIKRMEQELGIMLFVRDNQKSILTEEGKHIYQYANELLKNYNKILSYINSLNIDNSSHEYFNVRFITTPFTNFALYELLSQPFLQPNPAYMNTCTECTSIEELRNVIKKSNINIGLIMVPKTKEREFFLDFGDFDIYKLYDDTFAAFMNSSSTVTDNTLSLNSINALPQFTFSHEYPIEELQNIRFVSNRHEYHVNSIFKRNVVTFAPNLLGSSIFNVANIKKATIMPPIKIAYYIVTNVSPLSKEQIKFLNYLKYTIDSLKEKFETTT